MVGKYIKSLVLIVIAGSCTLCFGQNDWTRFGLHGKVKSYLELHYDAIAKMENIETGDNRATFDKEGIYQCIEYFNFVNSGKLFPVRENGKLTKEEYYTDNGTLMSTQILTDKSADEIAFTAYTSSGIKMMEGVTFFANNRFSSQKYKVFDGDRVADEFTVVFEYNADGNLISKKQTNSQGTVITFKYEYLAFDAHKNWTKRLDYESGKGEKPVKTVTREYEYFDEIE